jgi:hypothetical protein
MVRPSSIAPALRRGSPAARAPVTAPRRWMAYWAGLRLLRMSWKVRCQKAPLV